MKTFSPEEISRSDGKEGRPALVIVDGQVYDVSSSKRWAGGLHMRRHQAGSDLSADLKAAPHGTEMLERVALIGRLSGPVKERSAGIKGTIEDLLDKHPFFRRHPHPAMVHFPLGLLMVTPLLEVAAILTGSSATEWAAYLTLAIGTISILAAIVTGYLTWWLNYEATDAGIIRIKRRLACIAFAFALSASLTRTFLVTDPLQITDWLVIAYVLNIFVVAGLVGYTGFLGGKLTFPYE